MPAVQSARSITDSPWWPIWFLLGHVVLALVLARSTVLAQAWVVAVLLVSLGWTLSGSLPQRAIHAAAYIGCSDVLWRMTGGSFFWELGKYAMAGIFLLTLLRSRRLPRSWMPAGYFLLLLPSALLTWNALDLASARRAISFNLSGPFALAVAALVLGSINVGSVELKKLCLAILAPVVSVWTLAVVGTRQAGEITFGSESLLATSGGYGPNQVSSVLGLGAAVAFLFAFQSRRHRWIFGGLGVLLTFQSILTFSRGGVLNLALALFAFGVHQLSNDAHRKQASLVAIPLALVFWFVVMPHLDQLTDTLWRDRYSDFNTAGRLDLSTSEFELFRQNPWLGVGPGMSSRQRDSGTAAHTEFSRLLAEHGLLGLLAFVLLMMMALRAYRRAPTLVAKGWVAAWAAWSLVQMGHAGMRIAPGALVFGLALLCWPASSDETGHIAQGPREP